jgi:hypothetical protein
MRKQQQRPRSQRVYQRLLRKMQQERKRVFRQRVRAMAGMLAEAARREAHDAARADGE